jgi:protein gp37
MAEYTKIQWADHTFNGWIGCQKVHEGCKNCYAEAMMDLRYGRVRWGGSSAGGTRVRTKTWKDPLRWDREAARTGTRPKVFCMSLADVFEDHPSLSPWRSDLFRLIDRCRNLTWLLLTKRPENVRRMWEGPPREHVWLGTSVSDQPTLETWGPRLLSCGGLAARLFLSVEPQLGPVRLAGIMPPVSWVIVGGESAQGGSPAREFRIEWARSIVEQCRDAAVACFVKQLGSNADETVWSDSDRDFRRIPLETADRHGGDWSEWPADLRVRECPESYYPELATA